MCSIHRRINDDNRSSWIRATAECIVDVLVERFDWMLTVLTRLADHLAAING
jgi:hypothetical protein